MRHEPYLFPFGAKFGVHNLVLCAWARRHHVDECVGPLSVKTLVRGQAVWTVQGRALIVNSRSFLIVAFGEKYSIDIDAPKPVGICSAFFASGFVEQVAYDLTSPIDQALDGPERTVPALPDLSAVHMDRDRAIISKVQNLARKCKRELAPSGYEQEFLNLAAQLLMCCEQIRSQRAHFSAARGSTRRELHRRVLTARDYMHSHLGTPISLHEVARKASLSPYQLHHGFIETIGQTPHQCLSDLQLERARQLIQSGTHIRDVCIEIGFLSTSAFSRLFRARFGTQPPYVALSQASSV